MKKFFLWCVFFASSNLAYASDQCNYADLPGKEFSFRERSTQLQRFGYLDWKRKPEIVGKTLDYQNYVGLRGKIQETPVEDGWFEAVLETCERVYTSGFIKSGPAAIPNLENHTGIYFMDTLRFAESLVGTRIWAKLNGSVKKHELFTDEPNEIHPLGHLEPLEIEGIETKYISHGRGAGPLYLLVRKQTGEEGYLAFNDRYFFKANPIDARWDRSLVDLIRQRKLKVGMTREQVLLSWGEPERVSGSRDAKEQWIYGQGQYVNLDKGRLTRFQLSR